MPDRQPLRIVNATAPIRICDNGGWTDTWFAEYGNVFNIAVAPCAEVQIEVYPRDALPERVTIHAENYGDHYSMAWGPLDEARHPLLEATVQLMGIPDECSLQVTIFSNVPAGASTGTSAAVAVALIGALDALTPGRLMPHEVAYKAWSVEVEMLGQQSGIQDQLCSAYGGINYIEMFRYPWTSVSPVRLPQHIWWELERRLLLVYLGKSHRSDTVHEAVIQGLENAGPECQPLNDLRALAKPSSDALYAGDFAALGRAMIANTEAQSRLHPELVGADARRAIELAKEHGAAGWKVNGAGGSGGSLTILCQTHASAKRNLIRAIEGENPLYQNIPISLSRYGLRVWE